MSVFVEIIIMLLILGILISIHEAGHLSMAKLFKVYCFEYSIGMGPAILHKKRKGGETYFSIRAIPFGGYVSMFGEAEAVKLEEGEQLPDASRSIENIAKWKKVIILFAGVFLNFILGLLLMFISIACFTQYYSAYDVSVDNRDNCVVTCVLDDDTKNTLNTVKKDEYELDYYYLYLGQPSYKVSEDQYIQAYVVSTDVVITSETNVYSNYVALYQPNTLMSQRKLITDLVFYPGTTNGVTADVEAIGINLLPDIAGDPFSFKENKTYNISMSVSFAPIFRDEVTDKIHFDSSEIVKINYPNIKIDNLVSSGINLSVDVISEKLTFKESVQTWAKAAPQYTVSIVKGIIELFTTKEGIESASSVVGMTSMVGTLSEMGGASMVVLLAGVISVNLAIFNLLPFPGLDGYQIIVTVIEGITKKKIPTKVKAIVSFVGLALLFIFMGFILIKDILVLV